jgi:hypothetical protein
MFFSEEEEKEKGKRRLINFGRVLEHQKRRASEPSSTGLLETWTGSAWHCTSEECWSTRREGLQSRPRQNY